VLRDLNHGGAYRRADAVRADYQIRGVAGAVVVFRPSGVRCLARTADSATGAMAFRADEVPPACGQRKHAGDEDSRRNT